MLVFGKFDFAVFICASNHERPISDGGTFRHTFAFTRISLYRASSPGISILIG